MTDLKSKIRQLAEDIHSEIVSIRRHLHQHPELSFEEAATAGFIAEKLQEWGIPHQKNVGGHGVIGLIQGKNPENKTTALRADMDALPIQETNDVPYRSRNDGVMHACGHDVHTASLLGSARILNEVRSSFEGTIKLIFQPAEERMPGGASILIKEGVLENPAPANIFGQHVHPPLETGKVGFCPGRYMASADELYITVKGRGGHGALPHNCIDPVAISAQILVALQQLVSRMANPFDPTVLTFGKIASTGGATNVIPNEVKLEGTFRSMNEDWRSRAHKRMVKVAKSIAESMGGACEFTIVKGYPVLFNDETLTFHALSWAQEYLGADKVVDLSMRMSAEDFAYYTQKIPGCFYRLGTGNKAKGIDSPIHTNTFDVDEDCFKVSTGLMAWLAINALSDKHK